MCTDIVRVLYKLGEMRVACERSSRVEMCVSPQGTRRSYRSRSRDFLRTNEDQRHVGGLEARCTPVSEISGPMAFMTGTIWLPLVTELSTEGLKTSPEKSTRPSLFPSGLSGHWSRTSSSIDVHCVTSIVSGDLGCSLNGWTR